MSAPRFWTGRRDSGEERPGIYWPRVFRITYQVIFLLIFAVTLVLMTDEGIRRFPVRWLLHLDPLAALTMLLSTWLLPVAFLWALVLVVLTLIFGRAFCGWMCPVGTLHHLVSWATVRLRRGAPATLNRWRPHFRLKYGLLVALLVVAASGSLLAGLFDPLSLGLRSFTSGLLPAGEGLAEGAGFRPRLFQGAWLIGALFLALLVANRWIVRWWCRALCPPGGAHGLDRPGGDLSHRHRSRTLHPVRAVADDCQGADEPFGDHRVSECHVCLNCAASCPEDAISFQPFAPTNAPSGGVALPRRQFLGAALTGAVLWPLFRASTGSASSLGPEAIRPPGSLPEEEFLARCVRCGACGNACPTAAIQPALDEAGIEGLWTPIIVPRQGWCEPSCTLCGQVCPTGAIRPMTAEEKGWTQSEGEPVSIGTAFLDHGRCLPWGMNLPCIVCQEVCPTIPKAILLEEVVVPGRNGEPVSLQRPRVDPEICIGCGLCEAKCPVTDLAAIRVTRIGESRSPRDALTLPSGGEAA